MLLSFVVTLVLFSGNIYIVPNIFPGRLYVPFMIWIRGGQNVDRRRFLVSVKVICRLCTMNSTFDSVFGSRFRSRLTDEHIKYGLHCAQVIMNRPSANYSRICSFVHQLRNTKVNDKRLLIVANCFSLKRSIFNKWNNCAFVFWCYFAILHFFAWLT